MRRRVNCIRCVDCFNFKVRTVTISGTQEDFKELPFKIRKALKDSNSVKVYRCTEGQLTCEVYIENKTIQKRINRRCRRAISMGRIKR